MNKGAIIFWICLIVHEITISTGSKELYRFISEGMRSYFVMHNEKLNWYEAYELCRSKGLRLASPKTATVNVGLKALLIKDKLLNVEGLGYWISLTDLGQTNTYKWLSTGESAIYTDFLPGQPSHNRGPCGLEHCVGLFKENGKLGWHDRLCTEKFHFICEK